MKRMGEEGEGRSSAIEHDETSAWDGQVAAGLSNLPYSSTLSGAPKIFALLMFQEQ